MEVRDAYETLRREGFPELKDEPAPEPDFGVKLAGRSFQAKEPPQAGQLEKLGLCVPVNWESVLLWCVAIPAAAAAILYLFYEMFRELGSRLYL